MASCFTGIYYQLRILKDFLISRLLFQPKEFASLKNKHLGERCFIVSTGPSLTLNDLNLLKNEFCFSMNSIINSFGLTSWRPTYYVISDQVPFFSLQSKISYGDFEKVFIGNGIIPKKTKIPDNCIIFNRSRTESIRCEAHQLKRVFAHMSKVPWKYLQDGPSVVFCIIQIAAYMGFKEIYLIGQDCSYNIGKEHSDLAKSEYSASKKIDSNFLIINAFKNYKKDLAKRKIKIFNCTRGGQLEVFPRKRIEDVLDNKAKTRQ